MSKLVPEGDRLVPEGQPDDFTKVVFLSRLRYCLFLLFETFFVFLWRANDVADLMTDIYIIIHIMHS